MRIDKTFSKTELIDIIRDLGLDIIYSHSDNKTKIQNKIVEYIRHNKSDITKTNIHNIVNTESLIIFLTNKNPKKVLSIKEKNNVMHIAKTIISYCKNGYFIETSPYKSFKDVCDDMDYIKQFGDIPSCRRACKLMNLDDKVGVQKFMPLVSPQTEQNLIAKKKLRQVYLPFITIKHSTPEDPIIVSFD